MTHVLSVDVEDYFQVEAFAGSVHRESWDHGPLALWPTRSECWISLTSTTSRLHSFLLGGWPRRFPHLVREVQSRGHELACHSYWHRTVYSLTPDEFRKDTRQAKHGD